MGFPRRGEIWQVNFNPTVGREIRKARPALVISNNINNEHAGTVTVLPVSDKGKKVYPFEALLAAKETGLKKDSKVKCQQIRTVDKSRLVKHLGQANPAAMGRISQALLIHLGMFDNV